MTAPLVVVLAVLQGATQSQTDAFFSTLQRATARNDRQAVAAMMAYPLNVTAAGVRLPIRNEAALIASYDAVFTADLKAVLAERERRDQFIIVMLVDGAMKVTEIRVPVATLTSPSERQTPSSPANAPARGASSSRAPAREPERIVFRSGGGSGRFAGMLRRGETASYVFRAGKGQLLDVRIERVRANDVVARIAEAKTRTPLDARAAEGARVWTGRLAAEGDYRVDVVRLAKDPVDPLTYTLVISLR